MSVVSNLTSNALVVDLGTSSLKADLAIKTIPTVVFNTVIGRPKFSKIISASSEFQVVSPMNEVRGLYELFRPIKRGVLASEADAHILMERVFSELTVSNPKETPMFMAEPPLTSVRQKRMLADLAFEKFESPFVFFGTQSVLSLYAFGKTDGILMESGDGVTQISTVLNGYKVDNGTERLNFAGSDVTDFLKVLFKKSGIYINSGSEHAIFEEIKRGICQVNTNVNQKTNSLNKAIVPDTKSGKHEEVQYTLPDGRSISVGIERFVAPELLFNPSLGGFEFPGLAETMESVLSRLDSDLTKVLTNTIYLAGGNTQITGFADRFAKELSALTGEKSARLLNCPNTNRSILAWQGGAIICNMPSFAQLWISKKELDEQGDRIFHIKQF